MDEQQDNTLSVPESPNCVNCKVELALDGYPTKLCQSCRNQFVKYPIPKWIYAFGAGILMVMIISLVNVPKYLSLASDLGKAQSAINAHKYITAEKEATKVLASFPDMQEAKAYLLIAASYNMHIETAKQMYGDLQGKKVDIDAGVQKKAEQALNFIVSLVMYDSTIQRRIAAAAVDSTAGLKRLFEDIDSTASDYRLSSELLIADKFYDLGNYLECRDVLANIGKEQPDNYSMLALMAATNRRLKNYDKAIDNCDRILAFSSEDVNAMAQKAKIELLRNNATKAAEYVTRMKQLDPKNVSTLEAGTLLAFTNHNKEEMNKMLADLREHDADSENTVYNRTFRIVNGAETFN